MKKRKTEKKEKNIITGKMIEIKDSMPRHKIVKKVVDTFIKTEYHRKGKGIKFQYPVENLLGGQLFIVRPGHKKNFDFKVDIISNFGLGKGGHSDIAKDLRNKKQKKSKKFKDFINAITEIYNCIENDVDLVLKKYSISNKSFKTGARSEVLLKVVKWLFIMEDIVYWDNEGRAFLFNFLRYVINETDNNRLKEVFKKVKSRYGITPEQLKSFMKKCNDLEWVPFQGKK
ncbi:MAG TPA: hypothetical protein VMX17_05000 [Candidatus Glassbacteria bacterium]|nr:hypothetical protein [Candidatus Glassbacteria bacterium]